VQEHIVVVSDGTTASSDEMTRAAESQSGTGALEVLHVIDEADVPTDGVGRVSRIRSERARLDREVDLLAKRFPLLRVSSRVLVGDPAAVRRGLERLGARVLPRRRPMI
jgi:hypothetical protein